MWRFRVVPLAVVEAADVDRWRQLSERAIEPNMYLDPRFLAPAGRRPDAQDIRLVFAEYQDELRGVLAFTIAKLEDRWPVRVADTGGTFMTTHGDRQHPLVAPEDPVGTVRTLLQGIRSLNEATLVLLRWLPDGLLADAVATVIRSEGLAALERVRHAVAYAYPRSGAPGEDLIDVAHMSKSSRKGFRQRVRDIQRQAGAPLRVVDRAADPTVLEEFLEFQASGWKGDVAQGGGAFLLDPVHERWYREVVTGFLQDSDVVVPTVLAGEQVIYMSLHLLSAGAAFGFIDAYHQDYAEHSPGAVGRLAEWGYTSRMPGIRYLDPAVNPSYAASTRLYPDRREHADLLIGTTPWGRSVVRALPTARRIRDRFKRS